MTIAKTRERHRIPAVMLATMLGGLALAGCSSGHVGDSWQCPLAEGGACDSVAAADPAVPDARAARKMLLTEPLWRQRAGEPGARAPAPCEAECGGGSFGWLMRLFGADPGSVAGASEEDGPPARARSPSAGDAAPAPETGPEPAEPAAAALPAEPAPGEDDHGGDSLRTGEVVARIWIAPFVDVGGVYREASWVRVVLEPTGWRLPR